ncbi:MAG: hypothetical protein KME30_33450 [Iphinoe sp. HA4291-MV1]|jgi:hypothetical protein|nr:hypothetical protein [Iphinoe sp. HA4291-MV1]
MADAITLSPTGLKREGKVLVSSSEPAIATRTDKMLWHEPDAALPQPWMWDATNGVWRSNTALLSFTFPHVALGTQGAMRLDLGVPMNTCNKLWLEELWFTVSARNAAFDTTNYWTFAFRWYDNSLVATTEYTVDTSGLAQNAIRRRRQVFRKIITPTAPATDISVLSFDGSRNNTTTALPLPSLVLAVKYVRT